MNPYTLQPLYHSFTNHVLKQASAVVAETVPTIRSSGPKYDGEGSASDGFRVQPVLPSLHTHTIKTHEPLRGPVPGWPHKTLIA